MTRPLVMSLNNNQLNQIVMKLPYYLLNVFTDTHHPFVTGNPLAVFADDTLNRHLDDTLMQAIASQLNLSETVFVFDIDSHNLDLTARLRIFTPAYELPMAGHPTVGTAFLLQSLHHLPRHFTLGTQAKPIAITSDNTQTTLAITGFEIAPSHASLDDLRHITGLYQADFEQAFWVDSGSRQLLLNVAHRQDLDRVVINPTALAQLCQQEQGRSQIYLWHDDSQKITARYFWLDDNGSLIEDSGTGSAAANLGAYLLAHGTNAPASQTPVSRTIYQGDQMGRPNRINLTLMDNTIHVGSTVHLVGHGELYLDSFNKNPKH